MQPCASAAHWPWSPVTQMRIGRRWPASGGHVEEVIGVAAGERLGRRADRVEDLGLGGQARERDDVLGTGPRDIDLIAGGKIAGIRDLRGRERPLDARRAAGGRAPAHHGARRRHVLDVGRPREPDHRAAGHLERGIEADVGARRDVLVHLDGDHVVAVDERARGDGEGEQEGLVRAGHGGRGRRRVDDRGDRHVRAHDLVAVEVDDRAVVALELELERGDRPDVAHREDPAEVGGDVVAGGAGRRARAAVHDGGFAAVAIAELGRALRPAAVGEGRRAPGGALVAAVVEVAPGRAQRDQEVAHVLGQRRRRRGERPQAEDHRDHERADDGRLRTFTERLLGPGAR